MVVKIYIENAGRLSGRDMPEALGKLDTFLREKYNDSVPQALLRSNGKHNGGSRRNHSHRARAGDMDPVFRRLFSRRRRG